MSYESYINAMRYFTRIANRFRVKNNRKPATRAGIVGTAIILVSLRTIAGKERRSLGSIKVNKSNSNALHLDNFSRNRVLITKRDLIWIDDTEMIGLARRSCKFSDTCRAYSGKPQRFWTQLLFS